MPSAPRLYSVGDIVAAYFAAVAMLFVVRIASLIFVEKVGMTGFVLAYLVTYLGCGIWLSRFISKRIIFNPNFTTIASVAKAKWNTILTWPISVPVFIAQLFVTKYL